jgi:hypothetical protein
MSGEAWLRDGAELYLTAAERSRTSAERDRFLDCAVDLSLIADWISANRGSDGAATGAVERHDVVQLREVYASENGDRWQLGCDVASGRVFVRHEANLPSGGHVTDVELAAFLSGPGHRPEHRALIHIIGNLVVRCS